MTIRELISYMENEHQEQGDMDVMLDVTEDGLGVMEISVMEDSEGAPVFMIHPVS